jgi:hypothetical protein
MRELGLYTGHAAGLIAGSKDLADLLHRPSVGYNAFARGATSPGVATVDGDVQALSHGLYG